MRPLLLGPRTGAKYFDERVCLSLGSRVACETLRNFLCMLHVAVARSSSYDSAIRYVFPVLLMTSRFHTMDRLIRGSSYVEVCAVL